jgi:ecdysteroid 2-hydroxylase
VSAVLWLLHSIAKDKSLYEKVRKDIDANPNSMEAPLVRGSVREAMRLYPVAPFIGRFIDRNAEIGGYSIPKGTLVLASAYSSGHDPLNFSDPQKFIPDRWLRDANGEHKVFNSHATIPFAMGSRSCVGKKIALYQIHSLVTKVKSTFCAGWTL